MHCNSCNSLPELEEALYDGEDNIKQLSIAFFPSNAKTSRYVEVDYTFKGNETVGDCRVSYYWAVGGFLLIQPPKVFEFTSLRFSYPSNKIDAIKLTLPEECRHLVYNSTTGNCSCYADGITLLDVLNHHVSYID